jgi:predicted flap endonuclease-1-like 5' DNA nuclease
MSESDARRRARERQAALAALRQEVAATLAQARADRVAQAAATRRELQRYILTLRNGQPTPPTSQPTAVDVLSRTQPEECMEPTVEAIVEVVPAHPSYDDLTIIWGIGPALQQRLYAAGIRRYADLASQNPEQIRRALGESGRASQIEQWLEQARTLAGIQNERDR